MKTGERPRFTCIASEKWSVMQLPFMKKLDRIHTQIHTQGVKDKKKRVRDAPLTLRKHIVFYGAETQS